MDASLFLWYYTDPKQRYVEEETEDCQTRFICIGVPLFVDDGAYVLSDAQPLEAFLETFSNFR